MELSLGWPSMVTSLEPMRPLSPEILYHEQINIATDVDKLTRGERARKLLDHFDGLQQEESEPFDWFPNEKSIDIPFFESLPSPPLPDLKPSPQTYALPTTICINAADYQQLQQYPPLLSPNLYISVPSPVLYSPPPQQLHSPPPVVPLAQSTPPLVTTTAAPVASTSSFIYDNCGVKTECDPLPAAASASSDAEWLKSETLTPPESPKDEEILKMLEEIEPEALERLVMARADELDSSTPLTFTEEEEEEMSFASPGAHLDDCGASSSVCSRSRSVSPCTTSDGGLDDPEWTPPSRARQHSSSARGNSNNNINDKSVITKYASGASGSGGTAAAKRRASKPYKKPVVEERRQRKKEQNKNAATRYRMKKKVEVEVVKQEEQLLLERNEELRKKLDDISREVRYLKSLMRELYCKKGLIK